LTELLTLAAISLVSENSSLRWFEHVLNSTLFVPNREKQTENK